MKAGLIYEIETIKPFKPPPTRPTFIARR